MTRIPEAVAFDVNETLFSLDAVRNRIVEAGLPAEALEVWFARVLRDGFALAATGDYRPFRELASTHLRALLPDEEPVDDVLGAFAELDPYPDVEPALRRLQEAGVPAVTLTNGHADTVRAMMKRAGLDALVVDFLSVDEVEAWKPLPAPYQFAAQRLGVDSAALAMVAVHSWDIHGANRAGLITGYCPRLEGAFIDGFAPPDVQGEDLTDVIDALLRG